MALCLVTVVAGCGDEDESDTAQAPAAGDRTAEHPDRTQALASADVGALLESLAQDHAAARGAIGPHALKVHVEVALAPQGEPPTPEAEVGKPRPVADAVRDDIELVWGSAHGRPPLFSLAQHNDHDHGRDVVVADERMYTRHEHRGWYVQTLQADVWELWLDDAQRSVSDVVALAAPRLHVESSTRAGEGLAGGDAIALKLALADAHDPARVSGEGLREWRKDAEITAIAGDVLVDAKTGLWLTADVRVSYAMAGPDGRPLHGNAMVSGAVTPLTTDTATVKVPTPEEEGVAPLLERTRYEVEQARLLDGLAGR
jgi:hypothetical protein